MATQFRNCVGMDRVVPSAYYRLVLSLGAASAIMSEGNEDYHFKQAYDAIQTDSALVPTMPYSRAPGETSIVVDCKAKIHAVQTVAEAARVVDQADWAVSVLSIEKLDQAPDAVAAPAERQRIVDDLQQHRPTIGGNVAGLFGGVGDTVKWAIIAVAAVLAVTLAKDLAEWS